MLKYMEPGKPGQMNFQCMAGYYLFGSRICRQHQHKHLYSMIVEILNFQIAIILKIHDTTG